MEYFAFGETFVEEHKNSINSPFKFNGKELDEESGLYYYGARYYDPRLSIWASVDPLANFNPFMDSEHYINGDHNGGVFNHFNHNSYSYCYQSPIIYIDPNGKQVFPKTLNINKNDAKIILENINFENRSKDGMKYSLSVVATAHMVSKEGFTLKMYDQDGDKIGNATIGIGHYIHSGRIDGRKSEEEFKDGLTKDGVVNLFVNDIQKREIAVNKALKKLDLEVTQDQYEALVDIKYNLTGKFDKIIKTLKKEGKEAAAKQVESYNKKNKQLHLRRLENAKKLRN